MNRARRRLTSVIEPITMSERRIPRSRLIFVGGGGQGIQCRRIFAMDVVPVQLTYIFFLMLGPCPFHMGKKPCRTVTDLGISLSAPRPGNEQPNSSVKGSGANHYPRAAAQQIYKFIDQRMLYRGKLVLKQWKELNVSLLPNDEKTCIQSLIHNLKSYSFCVHVSTIHTVTSRDV